MMKKIFLILGGVACLVLIVAAMYTALTIGISVYVASMHQKGMLARKEQMAQMETSQMQQQLASLGDNMGPDVLEKKQEAEELAGKLPTLFVDSEGYKTEDNWLATKISREIAEMAFMASHPDSPLPNLTILAEVYPDEPRVHIEINGFSGGMIASDLTPTFAWDPDGYALLARQLLGGTPGLPAVPDTDETDVLGHLLNLTGPNIAVEDVRLSTNLQQHPTSWQDHEAAALILTALALREHAGAYSEKRVLLSRATAHLAVAQALRGNQAPTRPGLIADAAIRTLAGRELDALAHLYNLNAQPDLPDSVKSWITALRLLAKQDWRVADVTSQSPLLLKITWFHILHLDLVPDVAAKHIEGVVPQPPQDPNAPLDQQKMNPETLIPDWGRIAGRSPFYDQSEDDAKNGEYRLDLEFHELDEILKMEGAAPFDLDHLASVYSEQETDTVSRNADGKTVVRVIGSAGFKAASRRHVFAAMIAKSPDPAQDPAQIEILFTKFDRLLQGVPGYDLARLHLGFMEGDEYKKQIADWVAAKKSWQVWEVPYGLVIGMPGYAFVKNFYRRAVPFGTVFEPGLDDRYVLINAVNPDVFPSYDTPELERIKKLPVQEASLTINAYNLKYNALLQAAGAQGPKPFELELLKLAPDEYILAQDHIPNDKLMAAVTPFLDYNMNPIERIESLDAKHLSDTDRITILRKHVALEPAFGFRAGVVLRSYGKEDEAAGMERKAFAAMDDPIGISNSVLPLVDYDLAHGFKDEALKVAQSAGQTDSEMGLGTYSYALEKLGRLDEAELAAKRANDLYSDDSWLNALHIRNKDRYPDIYDTALHKAFPDGLVHVTLSDFSGNPKGGDQIGSDSDTLKGAGLLPGDVVVALDGYRIDNDLQYCFVRALTMDSHMDIIIWRNGKYLEVTTSVPGRRLMVDIGTYQPK